MSAAQNSVAPNAAPKATPVIQFPTALPPTGSAVEKIGVLTDIDVVEADTASMQFAQIRLAEASKVNDGLNPNISVASHGWSYGARLNEWLSAPEQQTLAMLLTAKTLDPVLASLVRKMADFCQATAFACDRMHSQNARLQLDVPKYHAQISNLTERLKNAETRLSQPTNVVIAQQSQELEVLRAHRTKAEAVFKQCKEALLCPICREVAVLSKVVGSCGHTACQSCLKSLDDVAFTTLMSTGAGASARQHLLARRCPLCRAEIIGSGFNVLPLKELASILIVNNFIEVPDHSRMCTHLELKAINFDKDTSEQKHITALQIGCYAQSQLAQHSVSEVVCKITPEQWKVGVYVMFESAVSRVFLETFATTLHGKAGGVNVLVNAAQRMLAVQLVEKKKDPKSEPKPNAPHLLVKVATDGRFTITTATATNAVANTAVQSAPVVVPAVVPAQTQSDSQRSTAASASASASALIPTQVFALIPTPVSATPSVNNLVGAAAMSISRP